MILRGGELDGRRYLKPETYKIMASNRLWPASNVNPSAYYFPGDGFGFGLGFAVRTSRGVANPPGSIGELKWDGALGTLFLDRSHGRHVCNYDDPDANPR